jgi:hypothetical protein
MKAPLGEVPAFPLDYELISRLSEFNLNLSAAKGISKRQLIAGMALQGIASNPGLTHYSTEKMAKTAVQLTDALLQELYKY